MRHPPTALGAPYVALICEAFDEHGPTLSSELWSISGDSRKMPHRLNRKEKQRRKYERAVFKGFLQTRPFFAGSPIRCWIWNRKDPPDIYCWTEDGRKIGIELVSWIDETEMAVAKKIEEAEENRFVVDSKASVTTD
jgi:hypothetical protein